MTRHYEGVLGVFDYDDTIYEVTNLKNRDLDGCFDDRKDVEFLRYIGNNDECITPEECKSIKLPKGCINTRYMFCQAEFSQGIFLENFDTSEVEDMTCMFFDSCIRYGNKVVLGDKFDTRKVKNMRGMLARVVTYPWIDASVSIGSNFSTDNVLNKDYMFWHSSILPEMVIKDK